MATLTTEASIDKVHRRLQDVVKQLKPDGATLYVTGKVDEAQIRAAPTHLGSWKGKIAEKRMDKRQPASGTICVIDIRARPSPAST